MNFLTENFADFVQTLKSWDIFKPAISTLVLLLAFAAFRSLTILSIRRWNAPSLDEKRRLIIQVKNASLIILAAGLFAIWASELRAFAISMVAVAAAVAICTREVIQCFMGGLYKASARPFEIGDRIEINNVRGEVIDHNFLSTTLLEIGPAKDSQNLSGRQIVVPNSLMLVHPVMNQTLQQEYVLLSLRMRVYPKEETGKLEQLLLAAANTECASFVEPARWAMTRHGQREGLDLPRAEPRVTFQYSEDGKLYATLRFPAPQNSVTKTEQAILRAVVAGRGEVPTFI